MSSQPRIYNYKSTRYLTQRLRSDLKNLDFVLLYAYNGTGKTRLSMDFKEAGKRRKGIERDTLYFNAYTEDLFSWDNDLENDCVRVMKINSNSKFFSGFKELALEERISSYLERYGDFDFDIDYTAWTISFSRKIIKDGNEINIPNIKVSRGEENIFIWCIFLALCELTIEGDDAYSWVDYIYIDDPISSLDDNNAIAVACDLAKVLRKQYSSAGDGSKKNKQVKVVISSHHGLFYNVICNELNKQTHKKYFLHRGSEPDSYSLRATDDTPFFHHVAMLSELKAAVTSGALYTYHFNMLRSILEKTASFFGYSDFSACIPASEDLELHARALNLLSHGKYSAFEPQEMVKDNKELFCHIFTAFLKKYEFNLPEIFGKATK